MQLRAYSKSTKCIDRYLYIFWKVDWYADKTLLRKRKALFSLRLR